MICPCQVDAIPCFECAKAEEEKMSWMRPLAKANVENIRAGAGPTAAGLFYASDDDFDAVYYGMYE